MEQLVWSWNLCEILKPQALLPTIITICLGYAIGACKAIEAGEWEKEMLEKKNHGEKGKKKKKQPNDIREAQCHQNSLDTEEHRRNTWCKYFL